MYKILDYNMISSPIHSEYCPPYGIGAEQNNFYLIMHLIPNKWGKSAGQENVTGPLS